MAIDFGLDNLATCVTKDGASMILDGKQLFNARKRNIEIGKVNNQNFVQIPQGLLRQKLKYQCELYGIRLLSKKNRTPQRQVSLMTMNYQSDEERIDRGCVNQFQRISLFAESPCL